MNKIYIFLIITFCSIGFSCISTKVPNKEKTAKKRLFKHIEGIEKITNVYPNLSDTFTITIHDTIEIESVSIKDSFEFSVDSNRIDMLIFDAIRLERAESLNNRERIEVQERVRVVRNQIIKEVLKDTSYIYEDSLIHFTFISKGGKLYFKNTIKKRKIPFVKQQIKNINFDTAREKEAWRYWWFWFLIFIIVILSIIRNKK